MEGGLRHQQGKQCTTDTNISKYHRLSFSIEAKIIALSDVEKIYKTIIHGGGQRNTKGSKVSMPLSNCQMMTGTDCCIHKVTSEKLLKCCTESSTQNN
jgi:hypothetical protein